MFFKKFIVNKLINFTLDKLIRTENSNKSHDISNKFKSHLNAKSNYYAEQLINPIKENTLEKLYQKGITPKGKYFGQQFSLDCMSKIFEKIDLYSYTQLLKNTITLFEILDKIEKDDIKTAIIQMKYNLFLKFPHETNKELNDFAYTIILEALKTSNTRHNNFIYNLLKTTKI